jgi:hypothetical protein
MSSAARAALERRLAAIADPSVTIMSAPIRNGAPPLVILAPGTPYLRPASPAPDCSQAWRIDAWCITTREDVDALDTQDALADLVREVAAADDWQDADGMVCVFLGIERANVATEDLAGIPGLATIVQLRVDA